MPNIGMDRILGLCPRPQDFRRHISGVRWPTIKAASDNNRRQRPDAPSAHRRPGYPSSGCVPAEPDSVSPGNHTLASMATTCKNPSDTGAMPEKSRLGAPPQIKTPLRSQKSPTRFGEDPPKGTRSTVAKGDGLDKDAVDQAARGQEATIYAIGVKTIGRTTLFS